MKGEIRRIDLMKLVLRFHLYDTGSSVRMFDSDGSLVPEEVKGCAARETEAYAGGPESRATFQLGLGADETIRPRSSS